MEKLKPYVWKKSTGEVFCAYCGSRGLKPNKHGEKAENTDLCNLRKKTPE